jgi:hypothetical protein
MFRRLLVAVVLRGLTPQRATVHALPWRVVQIDIDAGNKRISSDTLTAYTVPTNQHLLESIVSQVRKPNENQMKNKGPEVRNTSSPSTINQR